MSFGVAPMDPEELAALQQQQPGGMPMPDAAMGQPAPAPATTGDNLMPPTADAGMPAPAGGAGDSLAQPAADLGAPTPPPGAPPAAAPTPGAGQVGAPGAPPGLNLGAEEEKLYGEQGELEKQREEAEKKVGGVRAATASAESQAADRDAAAAAQQQAQQQKVIDQANANTQKWLDNYQEESRKYNGMGLHDYWSTQSTGDKVLAGLAIMFGGAGRTDNSNNPGLKMVNDAIDRDFRMQQAGIEKQRGVVAEARQGVEMGLSQKQQALADLNMKKSAALDASAAQLVSLKLKQGVPLEQAQTDVNVIALRQKANATRLETLKAIHAQNIQDAQMSERQQHDRDWMAAQQARLAAKKKGAGGGGGGGGGAAATQWVQWAEANPTASETEKAQKADELHIPHDAKAGRTSLKTLEAQMTGRGKTEGGAAKADEALQARVIRGPDGAERGLVPTGKSVQQFQKDTINNAAAVRALKDLEKSGSNLPTGDKWANAVGAVASTTTMGKSNESIHIEGNQLKGAGGLIINHKAVRAKIEELEKRQAQLDASLEPLPKGFKSRAAGGGSAAPAAAASLSDAQAAKLIQFVKASPSDPRVPQAKQRLQAAGYAVQ